MYRLLTTYIYLTNFVQNKLNNEQTNRYNPSGEVKA